jgi:hypothetical protein
MKSLYEKGYRYFVWVTDEQGIACKMIDTVSHVIVDGELSSPIMVSRIDPDGTVAR